MNTPTNVPSKGFSEEAASFSGANDVAEVVPGSAAEQHALADFVRAVRAHYGDRITAIVLFGSRARGEARPSSDADVVVVLADGAWINWQERHVLSDLSYDVLLGHGLDIHPWPVRASEWAGNQPASKLVQSARLTGRDLCNLK